MKQNWQSHVFPSARAVRHLLIADESLMKKLSSDVELRLAKGLLAIRRNKPSLQNEMVYVYDMNSRTTTQLDTFSPWTPHSLMQFWLVADDANFFLNCDTGNEFNSAKITLLKNIPVNLVTSILSNFTVYIKNDLRNVLKTNPKRLCKRQQKLAKHHYLLNRIPALFISMAPNNAYRLVQAKYINTRYGLRFISCGRPLVSSLPFQELLNAFTEQVWIGLCCSIVVVVLFFHQSGQNWQFIAVAIKIYLEQGNPYTSKLLRRQSFSFLNVLILITGIVISNAYKNTNIYNMISPRYPVPYETYSQLISDDFSIFVRYDFDEADAIVAKIRILEEQVGIFDERIPELHQQHFNTSYTLEHIKCKPNRKTVSRSGEVDCHVFTTSTSLKNSPSLNVTMRAAMLDQMLYF